jgi:hypothetical protein
MSEDELKAELGWLRNENAALKQGAATRVAMKVSEKGALSVYGMGRFPVTRYKEQWLKLLAEIRRLTQFPEPTRREIGFTAQWPESG